MTGGGRGQIEACFRGRLGNFSLDAGFKVPATGVTAIFGPSGCGKTSVARCLAGLQYLPDSFCAIDGEVWQDADEIPKAPPATDRLRLPGGEPVSAFFGQGKPDSTVRRAVRHRSSTASALTR